MTVERQRFCPVCDRLFSEGEAVLRCDGCGIRHHPGCWVRNDGCVTENPHDSLPIPEAYSPRGAARDLPREQALTGTGGYVRPAPPPSGYVPGPPRVGQPPPRREYLADEMVIGRARPNASPSRPGDEQPPVPIARPKARAGRYPDLRGSASAKPMPSIYPGNRFLRYWYLPIAVLLAVVVAGGVIWGVERLTGGDETAVSAAGAEDDATPTAPATASTPPSSTSPVAGGSASTPTPPADGNETPVVDPDAPFAPGDRAVVADTGDCLNLRVAPGLGFDAVACLPDGTGVTVLGGPTETDGFDWWQLDTPQGQGWAASDYLERQ